MEVLVIGAGEMEGKMLYEKLMIACKEARGEIVIVDSVIIDGIPHHFDQSGAGVMGEPGVLTYSRRQGYELSSGSSGIQMGNKPDKTQRQAWRAMERKGKGKYRG